MAQAGDVLVLTKPLGSKVLLTVLEEMHAKPRPPWINCLQLEDDYFPKAKAQVFDSMARLQTASN
jgi:selenophosphate synthase